MDDIILTLMELLKSNIPELTYIDEDYGQLESPDEDGYPLTFPAVLIENPEADWDSIGGRVQNGSIIINIKLAMDCYDDTHYGSGTEDKIKERYALNQKIYQLLQSISLVDNMDGLDRIKSKSYTLAGGIKVYETIFRCDYHDVFSPAQNLHFQ